ncbi:MAG: L-serine ammonia-lyase [Planctomycetales bacterium]|nr:L-serine ammonia-lyase [Planctomycetales bacterium]
MISLFDLLKIGVGPSSSHTVGPMLAALRFVEPLEQVLLSHGHSAGQVSRLQVELFGSLALTGLGHRTDRAVIAGLSGNHPRTVDPESIDPLFERVKQSGELKWSGRQSIQFELSRDLLFHRNAFLPQHPNGLRCSAFDSDGNLLLSREYFSVGGGFVVEADELNADATLVLVDEVPLPFTSAEELMSICQREQLTIAEVIQCNELCFRSEAEIARGLDEIWSVMRACIEAGCRNDGILPGGLGIRRRAPAIYRKLTAEQDVCEREGTVSSDPLCRLDWVNLFALSVNEQNAAGGRVVTAPTNGAAGVIPAVCSYYERFLAGASRRGVHKFLKTASAVGMLYKRNASLSAAEMGCQGEVGVACSMAAAGLAAVMGGTPQQIENAAEIGMEHNLGLTCDPVAGLVQVPCIERNTMGAVKAINAARLAVLYGDGKHRVSLDKVIETMRQTGLDMQSKYKETSLGGLAVNITVC